MPIDSRPRGVCSPPGKSQALFCADLPSCPTPEIGVVLVTGGAGYIGGRLVPELIARGYHVRVLVRGKPIRYAERWPGAEIVAGDCLDSQSLDWALEGVHTAYYLIHSLALGPEEFERADTLAAANFRKAAERQGINRIIYLGGLGSKRAELSDHLRSRMDVAEELERGPVPVTILRAAVIIGSGSASYEIILHLVKRLPIIPVPIWARNFCQPIGIRDVIKYLVGVLEIKKTTGRVFDIGGRDILTWIQMLKVLAEVVEKKNVFVRCPIRHIGVYSYLASIVTPVPALITRCLMNGLKNSVCCRENSITKILPFEPFSYRESVAGALSREEQDRVQTRWSDAYPPAHDLAERLDELEEPPRYTASSSLFTNKDAASLFKSFCRVGGNRGWFHNNWMWRLRGMIDRLLLGVGTSRGRRSYSSLGVNDVIDFWRVEDLQKDRRLLLRAEMRIPGKAWLEFAIGREDGGNRLMVTAYYDASTVFGIGYWYTFLPFHEHLFNNLIRQIAKRS